MDGINETFINLMESTIALASSAIAVKTAKLMSDIDDASTSVISAGQHAISKGETYKLSFSSAKLAEQLRAVFMEFADVNERIGKIIGDESIPVSDFDMLITNLHSIKIAEFYDFLFKMRLVCKKAECHLLDVDELADYLVDFIGISSLSKVADKFSDFIKFRKKHNSPCCGCDCRGDFNPTTAKKGDC